MGPSGVVRLVLNSTPISGAANVKLPQFVFRAPHVRQNWQEMVSWNEDEVLRKACLVKDER